MKPNDPDPAADDKPQAEDPKEEVDRDNMFDMRTVAFNSETSANASKPQETEPSNSTSPDVSWVGKKIGRYEITQLLGTGGMGVVYRAHDSMIDRDVAIKFLPEELAADHVALQRFLSEAKAAGKLNHPHCVSVYEIAEYEGSYYLVMELVSGGSAEDYIFKQGAYSVLDATKAIADACRGLSAAHQQGLIHRDVKPANLLHGPGGVVKVADFGLAKSSFQVTQQLTQDGKVVGTPYFMSPEQCEARLLDARSDVYSLGATYFTLLTGKFPYENAGSTLQIMYAHVNSEPCNPSSIDPAIPIACCEIIQHAMAKNPEERYQSAEEMLSDLEAVVGTLSGQADIVLPSQSSQTKTKLAPKVASNSGLSWPLKASIALLSIIGLITLAVLIASLGGQDGAPNDPARPQASDPATPAADPTLPPIKVGILHSMTGTMSGSESAVADATLFALEEVNADGGLLGRRVEPIVADGRSDDETFAVEARRLMEEEEVCTIFGCWTSASRKTVVPIFEELEHLLIYPVQYEGLEESPNVIYLGAAPNQQILPAVTWAHSKLQKRRFYLIGSDYVFPQAARAIIKDHLQTMDAAVAGEAFIPMGQPVEPEDIQRILDSKADVILNTINGDTNLTFFKQLRHAGVTADTIPVISFSIGEESLRHLRVDEMIGHYAAWNYFQSIESEENEKFCAAFKAKFGPQRVLTDPMEAAYVGVKLWAQAVRDADSAVTEDVRRSMRNQRMTAPQGPVRIDSVTQHTYKTPRIGRIRADGQFDVVWEADQPVQPIPYPKTRTTEEWKGFLTDLSNRWNGEWSAPVAP